MIVWFSSRAEQWLRHIGREATRSREAHERIAAAVERVADAIEAELPAERIPTSMRLKAGTPEAER